MLAGPLEAQRLGTGIEVFGAGRGDVERELSTGREQAGGVLQRGQLVGAAEQMLKRAQRAEDEIELAEPVGQAAHVGLDDADAGGAHSLAAEAEHRGRGVERGDVVAVLGQRRGDAAAARAEFENAGGRPTAGELPPEFNILAERAEVEVVERRGGAERALDLFRGEGEGVVGHGFLRRRGALLAAYQRGAR